LKGSNAEAIAGALRDFGVRFVFGVPSGPVLPLIEALRGAGVEYVLTASETSAGFMASVVGELTGTPGVCVATLGPGATNLATGVGAAWLDRAPVLAITCNVGTAWLERRIQMRIDHHALMAPLTKASLPLRADNVLDTLGAALAMAGDEPPGPVHLDLPEDVATAQAVRASGGQAALRPPGPPARAPQVLLPAAGRGADAAQGVAPSAGRAAEATQGPVLAAGRSADATRGSVPAAGRPADGARGVEEALRGARRPLLVTGLGLTRSRALDVLRRFVERQHMPFISTLHAKGCLPESHPCWAGVLGRARRSDVQAFIDRADLILSVGYDPVEINYEEWVGSKPIVHVDREPPDVPVAASLGGDLDQAIEHLAGLPKIPNDWTAEEIAEHRQRLNQALRPASSAFAPHHVLDVLQKKLPADAILAYDVGAHTHQIATQWRTDLPLTCISTNGWSSMGFGLPAAYAAKLVHPERTVVGVVGDGCFLLTAGELSVARRLQLNVPVVVLNDGWLALIKVKQERKEYALEGVRLGEPPPSPPHYFGVPCRPAHDPDELEAALAWGLQLDGPSVIEAFIDVEPYSTTVYD
jgi:acetolactate synthase-1/2/3 large subunit